MRGLQQLLQLWGQGRIEWIDLADLMQHLLPRYQPTVLHGYLACRDHLLNHQGRQLHPDYLSIPALCSHSLPQQQKLINLILIINQSRPLSMIDAQLYPVEEGMGRMVELGVACQGMLEYLQTAIGGKDSERAMLQRALKGRQELQHQVYKLRLEKLEALDLLSSLPIADTATLPQAIRKLQQMLGHAQCLPSPHATHSPKSKDTLMQLSTRSKLMPPQKLNFQQQLEGRGESKRISVYETNFEVEIELRRENEMLMERVERLEQVVERACTEREKLAIALRRVEQICRMMRTKLGGNADLRIGLSNEGRNKQDYFTERTMMGT